MQDNEAKAGNLSNNTQVIAAGQINTKFFARSDLHFTDFILVDKNDILNVLSNGNTATKRDLLM